MTRVLLLGSGGRESALAAALDRSARTSELVAAPGNPGISRFATCVAVDPLDVVAVEELCRELRPGLVVVGPEAPLVEGIAAVLRADGIPVFGPDAAAARIEGSKFHAKEMMRRAGIPTAGGRAFESVVKAVEYMDRLGPPYVIKADGLAAGKGVVVTEDRGVAISALEERLVAGAFGKAGRTVVIEEYLDGPEVSLIAFSDGRNVLSCEPAQDYKRALDEDEGANTGGMGSYSPVPVCPPRVADEITAEIIEPMVRASANAGAPFVGALYAGLALTSRGPKVVEFNVRFGDPETQALVPRLESDLTELCLACATSDASGVKLRWRSDVCVSVVLASRGYPGDHSMGVPITGIDVAAASPGVDVFHAGTKIEGDQLVTAGGRVLSVSALAPTFAEARRRVYDAANLIEFDGKHMRTDIGRRAELVEVSE